MNLRWCILETEQIKKNIWKITASPEGSKELLLEVEGVVPKAASKLGCSRLFWAGVTGDGEGAMKEPQTWGKIVPEKYKQEQLKTGKGQ